MNQSVFVLTTGPGSKKSLVTLGIINAIVKKKSRVAFFYPIVDEVTRKDNYIARVLDHFQLEVNYEESYGFERNKAVSLYNEGGKKQLFHQILSKYKNLQERFDFVVVEGVHFSSQSSSFDFFLNYEVAKNLDLPSVLVVNGEKKTVDDLADHLLIEREMLGVNPVMIVLNKTDVSAQELRKHLNERLPSEMILVSLPPEPLPGEGSATLIELKERLDATLITGKEEDFSEITVTSVVAITEIDGCLSSIRQDSLLVVPGDRTDLICAVFLAQRSPGFPRIAGMLLTQGVLPQKSVLHLIKEVTHSIRVLAVSADVFEITEKISDLQLRLFLNNAVKIQHSIKLFEKHLNIDLLEEKIAAFKSLCITPQIFQYHLLKKSKELQKHIVLPEGMDQRVLRAASLFVAEGLGRITLLGSPDQILKQVDELGLFWDQDRISLIDPSDALYHEDFSKTLFDLRKEKGLEYHQAQKMMLDASYFGTMMVYKGLAHGMVSGAVNTTAHTIRPALQFIKTSPGVKIVSSVFFMLLKNRVLVYADCAIVPDPDPQQLADIAIASAKTAQDFAIEPKIALLSYSSGNSGSGQGVDKVRKALELVKQRAPELLVEGPLQYDAAVDLAVGKQKMPGSLVAGQANVLIFPDLNAGNNTYKAVQRETGALAIGPVLQGLNKPVNDLSRGATVEDIYNTIIITSIQAARL